MKTAPMWVYGKGPMRVSVMLLRDKHLLNILAMLERATDPSVKKNYPPYKVLLKEAVRRRLLSLLK